MKKVKKTLACLLAALLIFSAVPMSALADEADTPVSVTVETNAEKAAQDTEPDAEPKPETTAEPTATPEASAKPSAEPTAEPSPEATEEPTESEVSAEPEATAEPTASPTPNPEDEISLLALGDEAVTRYRTVGINGNFSSNYLYGLGQYPLYDILLKGTSYPAYCLQHGKGRVNNGAYVQRDNYGMTEAMRRIVAYGFNNINSLQDGNNGWYSAETAKMMVTQHLVWLASEGYITVDGTNWSWSSGIDNDVERMANLAYNGSVVRSYYAELKDRLLRSEIVPSFAGKSSDGSDAQEIDLQLVTGKYTATVTDTNGVLDLFDFQQAGFDISRNGNTLMISTNTLPEQETTIIGAGYTVGDKNSIAVWEDRDQQANIQHQATCPGTTQTMAYIKIKGEKPKYTVTLTKTSADVKITNGNANYSLEGAVYYVYKDVNIPDYPYWNYKPYATFTTDANGHAELSKKLENGNYVTIEQVAPLGYTLDTSVHRFSVNGKSTDIPVVDDPGYIQLTIKKKDSDNNTGIASGDAKLEGAIYRVAYLENGVTVTKDITINASAVARLSNLPIGKLKVWEISAPIGYKLDSTVHVYDIKAHQVTSDIYELEPEDFTEDVFKGRISLHKQYETLDEPADEQGAEFDVYLKSAGSFDAAKETERDHITTGADGMATTKDLPYGTYVVHQTKGGNGRQLVADFDVSISEDGKVYSYDLVNVQKNAQLKIVKTSEDGVIEGIKFRVTRLEDGYSAEYTTNAAGEILTETLPIYADKDGATKYQYKVEELDTEETFGYQLPDSQTVELSEGEIASVSFHNVPIEIGTKATVEGEKEIDPLDKVTLTDTVSYIGLVPGKEYKVVGVLMDKLTGEKLLVNGQEIIAETTFIADAKNGSVDVTFVFDATGLHGKEIVVFEDLYRENIKVAAHADITDDDQTIKVKTPEIGTTASFEGEKEIDPLDKVTLTDNVSYKDLTPGKEYRVTGVLMDKSNGKELLINGEKVTAEATFIATETSGSVDVTFTFNATGLHGKEIVAFEDLYRENVLLATHADINDEGQTVKIKNPEIGTKATADGKKEITADKITITDVVSYTDLTPGKEYKLTGVLMNKATNDKLLIDGKEITAEATFTPKATTGEVEMTFTFDARGLVIETDTVVFETLYRDGLVFAVHADINDESQTVKVKPLHGSVSLTKSSTMDDTKRLTGAEFTVYSDANGNGIYEADTDVKVDTLTDLGNGEYKLNGLLYGKHLLVETKAPNRYYADEKVYAFAIEHDGDAVVISNNDKNNLFVDQPKIGKITLRYDEKTTPNSPKTGSSSNVGYWLAMLCVSAAGLIAAIVEKKKGKKPHLLSFLVAGVIAVAAVGMVADPVSADSVDLGNGTVDVNGNTATVTRTVTSDDKTTEAAFDDEITYDGKTYKLDRVDSYVTDEKAVEEEKEVSATEEILTGTKESKFPEAISKDFSGDKVVLQYVDTKYTETKLPEFKADITESVVLGTATSQPEAAQSITVKYHSDEYGIDVNVPLQLDHVENNGYTWTSDLSVPMTLYGIDSAYLQFGDALIPYDGGNPPLTGYESAYLASLGLSANSYRLSRVTWDGDAYTNADGELCRNAIVTGDRLLSTFTAVYGGKNVTVPSVDGYKATATYSGTQIVKTDKTEYSIRSVATYIEQNNEVPVAVIVGITIGTIALAAAIVIILFIISKKRKEKEAEQ
ncbi:VaFE repeat-containing surface-anchored protein [Hominenteromicrobium sp.]|uniref:VaFE repeat-containing surface-anchored protein n=1 Tax=Hominenteromicrobium sp. TaxID=3073581 RepID=UPI003991E1FD